MKKSMAGAVMALALAAVVSLGACGASPPAAGGTPGASPSATAVPTLSPVPTATPTAAPTVAPTAAPTPSPTQAPTPPPNPGPPAGFECRDLSGGSSNAGSAVTAVRIGSHDGFDRFVIEFNGAIPGYSIRRQATTFIGSPSGQPFTLEGDSGVLVRLQPVVDWTSYRSPTYFHPQFAYLREARMVENFEAVQQWGLGVRGSGCLRVYELTSPSRLVVDVSG